MIHFLEVLPLQKEKKWSRPPKIQKQIIDHTFPRSWQLFAKVVFLSKFSQVSKVVQNYPEQFELSCHSLKGRPKVNKVAKRPDRGPRGLFFLAIKNIYLKLLTPSHCLVNIGDEGYLVKAYLYPEILCVVTHRTAQIYLV